MKADTLKVQTRLRSKLRDRGVTPERAAQIIKDYNEETQARAKKLAEYEKVSKVPEFAKKVRERQ
jgi:SOS response regulatory protein OraA/RecX